MTRQNLIEVTLCSVSEGQAYVVVKGDIAKNFKELVYSSKVVNDH